MKLNLTNGFIGAAALVAVGAIAGHFIHVGPFTGQPYPPDSGCNGVAWNSNSSAANSYKIVFATPSGSSITVMVDFTWDYTPGYHHNVAMPAGNTFDIDQDACTNSNNVLTLNLHPQSSNPHLADPSRVSVWTWDAATNLVTVQTAVPGAVPAGSTGTAVLQ